MDAEIRKVLADAEMRTKMAELGFVEMTVSRAALRAGGVDARTLATGSPDDLLAKARAAVAQTGGRQLVLGPGCSVQVARTSEENLRALRRASELDYRTGRELRSPSRSDRET